MEWSGVGRGSLWCWCGLNEETCNIVEKERGEWGRGKDSYLRYGEVGWMEKMWDCE